MRALWSEKSIENNKKPACCAASIRFWAHAFHVPSGVPGANLLYNGTSFGTASSCAKIAVGLCGASSRFALCPRSGSGKQARGSSSQTGHDHAELRAEEKIYRGSNIDKQAGDRQIILRADKIEFEN